MVFALLLIVQDKIDISVAQPAEGATLIAPAMSMKEIIAGGVVGKIAGKVSGPVNGCTVRVGKVQAAIGKDGSFEIELSVGNKPGTVPVAKGKNTLVVEVVREGNVVASAKREFVFQESEASVPAPSGVRVGGSVLKKLGRSHFMLGVASSPTDPWIEDTRQQGCKWDMRYQYLSGGANVRGNWTEWNPNGSFVTSYCQGAERLGVVPVFSLYAMVQSAPGNASGRDEGRRVRINMENVETMKAYFANIKLFMQKAGEFGKPVILHVEPDMWGFLLVAGGQPDTTRMIVKSTGRAELASLDDSLVGFGKAYATLRDKYAPNVLLALHASKWGAPSPRVYADAVARCGKWDLVFTDLSDRDSGWKIAHNYMAGGAWWKDADFASFREWCSQIHTMTNLPLIAWQIPMGNTVMATCNNTEGHFMDNRPEYFLENYPTNRHIAEWAAAGFIGLLFGGGAGGCTSFTDAAKDGLTNPTPIQGNKGEKAQFPDDDGGYMRLRGANYFKSPLPLK